MEYFDAKKANELSQKVQQEKEQQDFEKAVQTDFFKLTIDMIKDAAAKGHQTITVYPHPLNFYDKFYENNPNILSPEIKDSVFSGEQTLVFNALKKLDYKVLYGDNHYTPKNMPHNEKYRKYTIMEAHIYWN